jgi:hypothetical protein
MGLVIFYIILSLFIFLIIFLLIREIMCWYWKINISVQNQESIIKLLTEINTKLENAKTEKTISETEESMLNNINSSF